MSVVAHNIAGDFDFEFACGQWSEMTEAMQAEWTIVSNTCGSVTQFGYPYATYDLIVSLYGTLATDLPLSIVTVDGITTISINPATSTTAGSMSALDYQKAQTYLEPVSLNTTGADIPVGAVSSITVVTPLLAGEYRTGDIFSVINNSNGERVKLTVTADTTAAATTIAVAGTSAYLIPSGAILVPIFSVRASGGGSGTVTSVAATQPAAGFTISGSPITTSGTFVFTLADDLAAIEGISGTGIAVRTAANTWTTRTLAAGTGISISNPAGVAGNPTITNTAPDQTVTLNGGTGISVSGTYPTFTIATTITQYTDELAQDAVGNILTDSSTIDFTYNDPANTITAAVIANSIGNTHIRQGVARSVIGVTGNATANVADIQGTIDQVLRVNTAGTALTFGQVATGGITDDAVTYAKIQNVVANNVLLGNIGGAGGIVTELTVAQVQTLLGYVDGTGVAGRNAFWTDANTLSNSANWLWDNTNGRVTIIPQVAGLGGGAAALNINPPGSGTLGSMEGLRVWGNIAGTLSSVIANTNTAATSHALLNIASGSNAAGCPILQFQIAGSGGHTTAMGLHNADLNKFKISPNTSTPGGVVNNGFIQTQDAVALHGINIDAPLHPLHVVGRTMAGLFIGKGNAWTSGNIAFGLGAGTGATVNTIHGHGNGFMILFTTGSTPTASGIVFTATFPTTFPSGLSAIVTFSAFQEDQSSTDYNKFKISAQALNNFIFRSVGTLLAGTTYGFNFHISGYDN